MKTAPVTERAVLQRINRRLGPNEAMKAARGHAVTDLGRYYTVSFRKNCVLQRHVDLEAFGRKLGALADFEHMER
jgi:hypothetical protein